VNVTLCGTDPLTASSIACDLKNFAEDRLNGADDWAYVDALSVRHELNQQGLFSGDIAMSMMMKSWK
jgi:hypothetical protein